VKIEEVTQKGRVFTITVSEPEAGELLALLNGVYQLPVGLSVLEAQLNALGIEQVGHIGRDTDNDPAWMED
jgi:hypothetical protein